MVLTAQRLHPHPQRTCTGVLRLWGPACEGACMPSKGPADERGTSADPVLEWLRSLEAVAVAVANLLPPGNGELEEELL